MSLFNEKIIEILNLIEKDEASNINKASLIMAECMKNDGIVHVFATGHSHMFAEELFYRAGGLVQIDPILVPMLMQHEGAIRSTKLERLPGLAKEIYTSLNLKENEPFIIVSNSGINSVPVEMAKLAKDDNHPVIVVTSLQTSKNLEPRNELNKHLYDFADVLIDNHVPYGDGVIDSPYGYIGSSSSIAGAYIAQSLVLNIINIFESNGLIPPVYISANIPGGDSHNKELYEKYKDRIKCLF